MPPVIGVLALQGGFEAHGRILRRCEAEVREVRVPDDLDDLDGLIIPGGESTTMTLGIEREGLAGPLRSLARRGTPVLGTCAGLIMLDRDHLGLMDIGVARNAFGRQVHSFEAEIQMLGIPDGPLRGVFIRAPQITDLGSEVQVLGRLDEAIVAARQGRLLAVAFHPELSGDDRVHRLFLEQVSAAGQEPAPARGQGLGL